VSLLKINLSGETCLCLQNVALKAMSDLCTS